MINGRKVPAWSEAMFAICRLPAMNAGVRAIRKRGMSYPKNWVKTLAEPIVPYGLHDAHQLGTTKSWRLLQTTI